MVNCGSFYIAKGKDALCLNKILGLKLSHMEAEVCKVGFPIKALEKYSTLIKENSYSYVVYKFESNVGKLEILEKYNVKYFNNILLIHQGQF